jgi:hypothetical protein
MKMFEKSNDKSFYWLFSLIKVNFDQALMIKDLKKLKSINDLKFDQSRKEWYIISYTPKKSLLSYIFDKKYNPKFEFINNDYNDYREENIKFSKLKDSYSQDYSPFDENFEILKNGKPVYIKDGCCAGQKRNKYWKVLDKNTNEKFYFMEITPNLYTKISKKSFPYIKNFELDKKRVTWRLNDNGYIYGTIKINDEIKVYYLHQYLLDLHKQDLSDYSRTVDHINNDKLDNRLENLRIVNMSEQIKNRDKVSRHHNARSLPDEIKQLPKYIQYNEEIYDKENGKSRCFFVVAHPNKLPKKFYSSKSVNISPNEKLLQAIKILKNIEENKEIEKVNFLPTGFYIKNNILTCDFKKNDNRYNLKMTLRSNNFQNELDKFIDKLNQKYPNLNYEKFNYNGTINYQPKEEKTNDISNIILPPNFSFFKEKNGDYCFQFSKKIDGQRKSLKSKIYSNNIKHEFSKFLIQLKQKYNNIDISNFQINDKNIKLNIQEKPLPKYDSKTLPPNFSYTKLKDKYYLQFCKKINGKRLQYKEIIKDDPDQFEKFKKRMDEKIKNLI